MGLKNPSMDSETKYLSTSFISRVTGISERQLNHWASHGVFGDEFKVKSSGYRLPWTGSDMYMLIALKRYVDCVRGLCGYRGGLTLAQMKPFVSWIKENPDATEVFISFVGRTPEAIFERVPSSPDYMRIILKGSADRG